MSGRPPIGDVDMRFRTTVALRDAIMVAAAREGMAAAEWMRRTAIVALERPRLAEERARFEAVLEQIAASRAVDPERYRAMARLGLGR